MLSILEKEDIAYLDHILLEDGLLKVVDSAIYDSLPLNHIRLFAHMRGYYCLPTTELVDWLRVNFDLTSAIEIGAGHGALARCLNIPATDSKLQENPEVKLIYQLISQPITNYPKDVIKLDAIEAIKKFKPKVVIGCWVTHLYKEEDSHLEGNLFGIDEEWLLNNVEKYIIIGNEITHNKKRILKRPHKKFQFPWLFSRSLNPAHNIIYVWG
jgi:hypothetical protein